MRMFDYLDRYLVDRDYKITISNNRVHILNYKEIEDFSSSRVVIRYEEGVTTINGVDLVVSKMQDEELVIVGKIESILV